MLANLDGLAVRNGDLGMLAWVLRLRASVPDAAEEIQRRLAAVQAKLN